jgi:putative transcriptional regulator
MTETSYRNRRREALHKTGVALASVGAIVDKATMRDRDAYCLTKVARLNASDIMALRERERVSQAVFERQRETGQRLGTRREEPERSLPQAADARSSERARRNRLKHRAP